MKDFGINKGNKMNKINKTKLLKLIDFLKNLPEEKFYFGSVVDSFDKENNCGTVCCAIGWLPAIFPDEIEWYQEVRFAGENFLAHKETNHFVNYAKAATLVFNIPEEIAEGLFSPSSQTCVHKDLPDLDEKSYSVDVAEMLQDFIWLVEQGEINGVC